MQTLVNFYADSDNNTLTIRYRSIRKGHKTSTSMTMSLNASSLSPILTF